MSSNKFYRDRKKGGQQGDVYTLPSVVSFMLDEVGYDADIDLSHVRVFEPSCGNGEFVIEIASRLYLSSKKHGFNFERAFAENIFASDIDNGKIDACIRRIRERFSLGEDAFKNFFAEDFLLSNHAKVDVVVGNPPYIRYEEIPSDILPVYKSRFHNFYYRTDIYVLFYEKSLLMLNPGGRHCFICSNRWLKNVYGKKMRDMISKSFRMEEIINMESSYAFQEKVLAYPAITLISNNPPREDISYSEISSLENLEHREKRILHLPCDDDWTSMFLDGKLSYLSTIQDQGFHIGIGVATGNESVFVSKRLKGMIEDELLLPCIDAYNLRGDRMNWDGRYLLNPFDGGKRLIDLDFYPKAQKYLNDKYDVLSKRHKARKNPGRWYATIDNIDRGLLSMPKILLPDISGNKRIFVDEGNFYPLHNVYYISNGTVRNLKMLAAILMSSPIRKQLDSITNHMNGGYVRWQSQYLKKLRIPILADIAESDSAELLSSYEENDLEGIDALITRIIEAQENANKRRMPEKKVRELTLNFEYA